MGRQDTKRYQVTRLSVTRSYWVILGPPSSNLEFRAVGMNFNTVSLKALGCLGLTGSPNFPQDRVERHPFGIRHISDMALQYGASLLAGISKSIHERKWINDDKWLWIKRYLGTPKIAHKWMSIHFTSENHGLRPLPMYHHLCSVKSSCLMVNQIAVVWAKSQFLMVKSLCFDGQVPILDASKPNFHGAKPFFSK